jgi:hypothetical protein
LYLLMSPLSFTRRGRRPFGYLNPATYVAVGRSLAVKTRWDLVV